MKTRFQVFCLALAATVTCQATLAAAAGVYTFGHGDIRAYYEGGKLKLRYQLDAGVVVDGAAVNPSGSEPVSFELNELVATIPETPFVQSPDSRFNFTGAAVGEDLWFIPEGGTEAEALELPWLGFSTEELDQQAWSGETLGELSFGYLQLQLLSVNGPAGSQFSLWYSPQDEISPPLVHFATSDGIDANDVFKSESVLGGTIPALPTSTHVHTNWFFNQRGIYDLTLKFSGMHLTDGYKEAIGTVRIAVGVPEPSGAILFSIGLVGLVTGRRRRLATGLAVAALLVGIECPLQSTHAAHVDITPYYEVSAIGTQSLKVGSYDLAGDGIQKIIPNVLLFTGSAVNYAAGPGWVSTADPGWTKPSVGFDISTRYPAGTVPVPSFKQNPFRLLDLRFNVVVDSRLGRNLSYWDGVGTPSFGPVPGGEIMDLYIPPAFGVPPSVSLDGGPNGGPGLKISDVGASFHAHTRSQLWGSAARDGTPDDSPTPGFYLYSLNLAVDGELSPSFFVLMAHGFEKYRYETEIIGYEEGFLFDEEGNLVLDEHGNAIPELYPIEIEHELPAERMMAAGDWVHANLAPVPEPGGFVLLLVGLSSVISSRKRRAEIAAY